jgi:hypothetical protein
MRLEIIIPDSTRPDLKARLTDLAKHLSARPELVDELVTEKAEAIPDYLAIMDQALQSANRFKSGEEVDRYIAELRAEW